MSVSVMSSDTVIQILALPPTRHPHPFTIKVCHYCALPTMQTECVTYEPSQSFRRATLISRQMKWWFTSRISLSLTAVEFCRNHPLTIWAMSIIVKKMKEQIWKGTQNLRISSLNLHQMLAWYSSEEGTGINNSFSTQSQWALITTGVDTSRVWPDKCNVPGMPYS